MTCKCGREITNVPDHLKDLAEWVCRECSNVPTASNLVGLTAAGTLSVDTELEPTRLKAEQAA
ncbi:MAG: hypothetical protein IT209_10460 [Armatimonadetes bacterium]|nr:hypothetical protein [Armatimonadota bacterium]